MKIAKFSFFILFLGINSYAQNQSNTTEKFKMSLVFGLNQPVITQGFNVELNYYTKYFVFSWNFIGSFGSEYLWTFEIDGNLAQRFIWRYLYH